MHDQDIVSPEFIRMKTAFQKWLKALNYNPKTINNNPVMAQEFFHWLEENKINTIREVNNSHIIKYLDHLKGRQNRRKSGKLSKNTLLTYGQSLKRFARYLRETGQESFEVNQQQRGSTRSIKTIFSKAEIKALYNACSSDVFGMRDKAMLSIYYGCGLRRNEGVSLDVNNILFNKSLVYVRIGKNYRERYVPMSKGVKEDLQTYINYARIILTKEPSQALFLNQYGKRLTGASMAERLQQLKEKAAIDKEAGLHILRHSIATHLLQSGMEMEQIKRFLGHSSLESTQIYTHIKYETTE
jgi:integrase/recombinase XerD